MSVFPVDFLITPHTWILPDEYDQFNASRELDSDDTLYILKPSASSCGRGIKIIEKKTKILKKEGIIASHYIMNPHLISGYKYDLRVYVLATSFDPLKVYVFNDGLVRFATEKYTTDPKELKKRYIHLTNFSVNKKADNYVVNKGAANPAGDENGDEEFCSKWDFKQLRKHFDDNGINYDYCWAQIKDIIVKTLIAAEPQIVASMDNVPTRKGAPFELYGFDIMLDNKLKPWLIEVNVLPSLSSSSPFDKIIKTMLVCDVLTLVGIRGYDKIKVHGNPNSDDIDEEHTFKNISMVRALEGSEKLNKSELNMILEHEEEFSRKGQFSRIFPLAANVDYYEKFF